MYQKFTVDYLGYSICQNKKTGAIYLYQLLEDGKSKKRFYCQNTNNKSLTRDELYRLGRYIVKYILPMGRDITICLDASPEYRAARNAARGEALKPLKAKKT